MTKRAESIRLGARAELRAWYLGHLRPRLVAAAAAGLVGPGAVEELDVQVAELFELPERRLDRLLSEDDRPDLLRRSLKRDPAV